MPKPPSVFLLVQSNKSLLVALGIQSSPEPFESTASNFHSLGIAQVISYLFCKYPLDHHLEPPNGMVLSLGRTTDEYMQVKNQENQTHFQPLFQELFLLNYFHNRR